MAVAGSHTPDSQLLPRRLALVGAGYWGTTWIPVIEQSPHWTLAALVDTDADALARAAGAAGLDRAGCFDSVSTAASAASPDAALVVVPPEAHAAVALEAFESGLHCLVEKPFAPTLAEALSVVERAEALGRVVMVSQQYRHRPGARAVAELVRSGAVGAVGTATVTFAEQLAVPGFQHELEEPLLTDVAIHHFDLVRGVLRVEPVRVQATTWNPAWSGFAGNASGTVVFEADDGTVVSYVGTLEPRGPGTGWDGDWEILCERGTIRWRGDDVLVRPLARPFLAKVRRRLLGHEWRGHRVKPATLAYTDRVGVLAELAAAIGDGREPETSGRDNLRSVALVIGSIESARTGTRVDIEPVGMHRQRPRERYQRFNGHSSESGTPQ